MPAQTQPSDRPPLILFEDEHLLVINKPAGTNTHAPSPYAGEGIYEWLRHREPRWGTLAIIQRLDKETSGVMVFTKSALANRSLTQQFTARTVRKKYLLLTDRSVPRTHLLATSTLSRRGEKYVSSRLRLGAEKAETRLHLVGTRGNLRILEAQPLTGRTHQIRVHAAEHGFPILGDTLYGGTPAERVYLHAQELAFQHPANGQPLLFQVPAPFGSLEDPSIAEEAVKGAVMRNPVTIFFETRRAFIDPAGTNAYRFLHGASDGWPGWYLDRLGDFLLSQSEGPLTSAQTRLLENLLPDQDLGGGQTSVCPRPRGIYHQIVQRKSNRTLAETSPSHLLGETAPARFLVRENGIRFELSFGEGSSVGLFLDQRDNRRRFLVNHVAADFPLVPGDLSAANVLNAFAYTCGFSVCAAKAGARTTSVDLSKKYLEWGRRNFSANQKDPSQHDFIYGDVFDWLKRLAGKSRRFEVIVLDPPTFSRSKQHGTFQAEKDYGQLVDASLPLLRSGGVLFASTNAASWAPADFLGTVSAAISKGRRKITRQHYVPQPPDFPVSRTEPAYRKTVWLRVE